MTEQLFTRRFEAPAHRERLPKSMVRVLPRLVACDARPRISAVVPAANSGNPIVQCKIFGRCKSEKTGAKASKASLQGCHATSARAGCIQFSMQLELLLLIVLLW